MHRQHITHTVLNTEAGRFHVDTREAGPGSVPTPIEAGPLLARSNAERSGNIDPEFQPFRREYEAILAARRNAARVEVPCPTLPIDEDLPASLRDLAMVIGVSLVGTAILVALGAKAVSMVTGG